MVPPAVPMVDNVLPGAPLLHLLLSLESTVLPELSTAHHDNLLLLLLHREQSLELVLVRQGCARACGRRSRHRPFGKYLLEVVSWDGIHIDGYWRTLPRAGTLSQLKVLGFSACVTGPFGGSS
jgi:hypothetical protein